MATYLEMQTRIAGEINRTNLTAEIKKAILSAVNYYEKRRWWWNEFVASFSTVAYMESVSLPSTATTGLAELLRLDITQGSSRYQLQHIEQDEYHDRQLNDMTGIPTAYTIWQDNIFLSPTPNAVYTGIASYIGTLATLNLDADTNAWTTEAEELIRLHAKKDLYANKIHDMAMAKDMQALEDSVLYRLESLNTRRTTTGRLKASYL
jgi:hypothetical protein